MQTIITDPSQMREEEMNLVDMHHHSTGSDGNQTPEFLARYFRKKKIGVCLTDHNQIKGSVYLAKQKGLFTIPSIEVTSREAKDVLAYFYSVGDLVAFWEHEIKGNIRNNAGFNLHRTTIGIFDLLDRIDEYSGVAVLAHPFALKPKDSHHLLSDRGFLKKIKGIESHNFSVGKYDQTLDLARHCNKALIAGSDSHGLSSCTVVTANHAFERDAFLESMVKRKHAIYCCGHHPLKRMLEHLIIFKNNVHLVAPPDD